MPLKNIDMLQMAKTSRKKNVKTPATTRRKKVSKKKAPSSQRHPVKWCELEEVQARRLILKVALGRDLGPGDKATAAYPNRLCDTITGMLAGSCMHGWKVTKFLSAGASGHVFRVVHADGREAAAKVQTGDAKRMQNEIKCQKAFAKKGLAPKIFGSCSFDPQRSLSPLAHRKLNKEVQEKTVTTPTVVVEGPTGRLVYIIIMEEIVGVLSQWLSRPKSARQLKQKAEEIVDLMVAFREHKLTHGDFHLNNIGYVYTDASKRNMKLMPIDFGRSHIGKSFTSIEVGSLMRTLDPSFRGKLHHENRQDLVNHLRKYALSSSLNYRISSFAMVAEKFKDHLRTYMNKFVR